MQDFRHLIQTSKTYATRANAEKALKKAVGEYSGQIHYLIAVTENGRFAPVVLGADFIWLAQSANVTVVG